MAVKVNSKNWVKKLRLSEQDVLDAAAKSVMYGLDRVNRATVKNVTGPHYKRGESGPQTGKMPIPRVSAMLANSITSGLVSPSLGIVYSNDEMAPYNKFVHDGTRRMKPRRFLKDAVTMNSKLIMAYWETKILKAAHKEGRKVNVD